MLAFSLADSKHNTSWHVLDWNSMRLTTWNRPIDLSKTPTSRQEHDTKHILTLGIVAKWDGELLTVASNTFTCIMQLNLH